MGNTNSCMGDLWEIRKPVEYTYVTDKMWVILGWSHNNSILIWLSPLCLKGRWTAEHFSNYSLRPTRFDCLSCSAVVSPISGEVREKSLMSGFLTFNLGTNGRIDCQWRKNQTLPQGQGYSDGLNHWLFIGCEDSCLLHPKQICQHRCDVFGLWRLLLGSHT